MKKQFALSLALGALAWLGVSPAATAGGYDRGYDRGYHDDRSYGHHGGHHHAQHRPHYGGGGHAVGGHVFISGYRSCGTPIHTERYLIGYDRRGYPVWGHRVVPIRHHYRPLPPPVYYGRPVCEPPPRTFIGGSYGGGSVVFHGSFGR